ncbi:MAG: NAD(P)-dependent oxidoreductase [Bdellovibrionales bacterium]|nr:NAD(P)-dependent oxidoreductase [Ramlibacter sp.]
MSSIHFIGVGKMGLPMALHLKAGGHSVTVSDPSPERLTLAVREGLTFGPDTAQAIGVAEVVFSSLPDDAVLRSVAQQVAAAGAKGAVYVDTSTVSQHASADAANACAGAGIEYLRCTVSGNNKMAEAAQLTVMVSGPQATYDRVLPMLKLLGPNHFYLGAGEQARLMKLVVNLLIAQTSAMLAEGLTLGRKGGLDWKDMWSVLCASAVASPILKAKSAQLGERDFTPTFTVPQMLKDLDLILGEGAASQVPLAQTAMTRQLMVAAMAYGEGEEDYATIIKVAERSAGLDSR